MDERHHDHRSHGDVNDHDHIIEAPETMGAGTLGPSASGPVQGPLSMDIEGPEEPISTSMDLDRIEQVGNIPDPVHQDRTGQEA